MSAAPELPLTGYAILGVHTISQEMVMTKAPAEPSDSLMFEFGWDWRNVPNSRDLFEVLIRVGIEPTQERPYRAKVSLVGRFKQVGSEVNIEREAFVGLTAIAILMPYARHHIAVLTQNTPYGPTHLPSVNVATLMKDFAETSRQEELSESRQSIPSNGQQRLSGQ